MKYLAWAFLAISLAAVGGCQGSAGRAAPADQELAQAAEHQKITAEEARQMMNDGDAFILLDVRTVDEFNEKRIEGAVLIPDYEIKQRALDELPDKEARILAYCRSGRRSALAAKDLAEMGYSNVYDFGGIIDWPYETISGEGG
jgi:rhodanese-related sulfurtransferase